MRRTKIVATLGPSTSDEDGLRTLLQAGVDVVRLNFSHGTADEHRDRSGLVRRLADELGRPVAVMQDLQGPKIRLGLLAGGIGRLQTGAQTVLVPDDGRLGTAERLAVSLPDLAAQVFPDAPILLNDGLVRLRVVGVHGDEVHALVVEGGPIADRKGVNLPGVPLDLPCLTEKDLADLVVGAELGVDLVALSFVRGPEDLLALRGALNDLDSRARIVAKIETVQALARIDEVIAAADAVMVARGDLGVEVPPEEVPHHQKLILRRCRAQARAAIVATQMLESMVHSPTSTRAEASDVANAVEDGAAALMLSAETSIGEYPAVAVATMARIAERAEADLWAPGWREVDGWEGAAAEGPPPPNVPLGATAAISHAAVRLAADLQAAAILTPTQSGATPRYVARFRPAAPIVAVTPDPAVRRQLALEWGVTALTGATTGSTDAVLTEALSKARDAGLVGVGELVVVTGGFPTGVPGSTDLIKVARVGKESVGER